MRMVLAVAVAMAASVPGVAWAQSGPVTVEGTCQSDETLEQLVRETRKPARIDTIECDRATFTPGRSVTFTAANGKTVTFAGGPGKQGEDIALQTISFNGAAPIAAFGLCPTEALTEGRMIMCAATYEDGNRRIGVTVFIQGPTRP